MDRHLKNRKMKKLIYILFVAFLVSDSFGQIPTNPVCDEALEIPYTFSYSGFIIFEDFGVVNSNITRLRIDIAEGSPDGNVLYSENHNVPFDGNGFFNVDIGTGNEDEFLEFILQLNEYQGTNYFIVVYLRGNSFNYERIGSKQIQTVPYAMVANSLGGIGERGIKGEDSLEEGPIGATGATGPTGPSSPPGATGPIGDKGPDGFGIMLMTDTPPNNRFIYVDDGTNTADGKPHLRTKVNGTWIDL